MGVVSGFYCWCLNSILQGQKNKDKNWNYLNINKFQCSLFHQNFTNVPRVYIYSQTKPSLIFINIGIKFHKYNPLKMPPVLQSKYSWMLLINTQRAKWLSLGTHARMIFSFFTLANTGGCNVYEKMIRLFNRYIKSNKRYSFTDSRPTFQVQGKNYFLNR